MAEQNDKIDINEVRQFVTPFAPDPKILQAMDETGVRDYHEIGRAHV